MAIKPILFNAKMVRAILDGRKSCTRRICKDANECTVPDMEFYNADKRTYAVHNFADKKHTEQLSIAERTCPICPGMFCIFARHGRRNVENIIIVRTMTAII